MDLSHNELTYLPTYLGHFSNLKKLLLDANPLESIPAEIRKGKLSGLLSYLRVTSTTAHARAHIVADGVDGWQELDKSKGEPWRRVKLLFVGKENVGKTSLLQALQAFMAHSAPSATHSSTSLAAGSSSSSAIFFSGQLHYTSDSKITVKVSERQSQVRNTSFTATGPVLTITFKQYSSLVRAGHNVHADTEHRWHCPGRVVHRTLRQAKGDLRRWYAPPSQCWCHPHGRLLIRSGFSSAWW